MFNWFGKPKKSEEEEYLDELARRSRAATMAAAAAAQSGAQYSAQGDAQTAAPTFRMEIDDVFTITGRGTVVTGQVESGCVHVGDTVHITGPGGSLDAVADGIEMFRKLSDMAQAGDNIGLLLRGVTREEVRRGDVITA